jgi:hypothetical protein
MAMITFNVIINLMDDEDKYYSFGFWKDIVCIFYHKVKSVVTQSSNLETAGHLLTTTYYQGPNITADQSYNEKQKTLSSTLPASTG